MSGAISHEVAVGSEYQTGLRGQRVAIVGYSHHGETDDPDFTRYVIDQIASGNERYAFFTSIRNYFGFSSHEDFWKRVAFFNFIPNLIGGDGQRYASGSEAQIAAARQRVLNMVQIHQPDKMFVFTTKGWADFPDYATDHLLGAEFPKSFTWGEYDHNSGSTVAVGLRHPQGADGDLLNRAVEAGMALLTKRS